ncbi:hypothetical protein ACFLQ2_03905 [archaeon]
MGLTPGAFIYLNVKEIERQRKILAGAAFFAVPAIIAFFLSKEAAIVLSLIELGGIYFLESKKVKIKTNVAEDLAVELKDDYQFIPKRKRSRVTLEKTAAMLVEGETGSFTINQTQAVIHQAFGEKAEGLEELMTKEMAEWVKELPRQKKGKDTYYKFKRRQNDEQETN